MKKIWITLVVIVVLIAAWLGAAWYTGTRIQAQTSDIVARLNTAWATSSAWASNNPRVMRIQIKQLDYKRGWLSSHARWAITSSLQENEPLMEYDVTLSHGPLPLAALWRGNFLPQQYQAHIEMLADGPLKMVVGALMGGKPPLVMDMGCSYGHHCTGTGSMPPIDVDLGPLSQNAKLAFGGVQMRFDLQRQSDTDYKASADAQLLPLSIGGQNFGSGQITVDSNAQLGTEVFSWKTDQGVSKLTFVLAATRPMPMWGDPALKPEDLPKLLKTASAKLELSKPMAVDLTARALNLAKGIDLAAARQQVSTQLDAMLTNTPEASKFVQTQGDLLVSDWQYADGKLTVNGQEHPEVLEQIKQSYQAQLHIQDQALHGGEAAAPNDSDAAASAASTASAPNPAASNQ
jgi:uncharacterized protein YdgA (DUF945 family)